MPETLVLMQFDTSLETCLRQIKIATYSDHYADAKILKDVMFQRTLDSKWELSSISVGFRADILFHICWIPRGYSVSYLLDSARIFCSISVGFRAEILFDSVGFRTEIVLYVLDSAQKLLYFCWFAYRNSTRSLLYFTQNFCLIPVGFRA